MVVAHKLDKGEIKKNYSDLIGKSWCDRKSISELLESEYMTHLTNYIEQHYNKQDDEVSYWCYPRAKRDVFNALRSTDFDNIKVVIFNKHPESTFWSNGIGFGVHKSPSLHTPPILAGIEEILLKDHWNPSEAALDKTLTSWAEEGVLMINTSLITTCVSGKSQNLPIHKTMCKNFIREIVKTLSADKEGLVFVFTDGEHSHEFKRYIDDEFHHILEVDGLDIEGDNVFDDINQIIDLYNDDKTVNKRINWI